MNPEIELIGSIRNNEDVKKINIAGLTPFHLSNKLARNVLDFILEYKDSYGEVPTRKTLRTKFDLTLESTSTNIDYLIDNIMSSYSKNKVIKLLEDTAKKIDYEKPDDVVNFIFNESLKIKSEDKRNIEIGKFSDVVSRLQEYEKNAKKPQDVYGFLTGIEAIDEATLGIHETDFWGIMARPGVGKTTLSLFIAQAIYKYHKAKPVNIGFIPLEMSKNEVLILLDSMIGKISFERLRKASLEQDEIVRYAKLSDKVKKVKNEIIVLNDVMKFTPADIITFIEQYKIGILFVDGLQLMCTDGGKRTSDWTGLTEVTRSIRQIGRSMHVPIIATNQVKQSANEKIPGMADGYYSDSFAQDASHLLSLYQDERMKKQHRMLVSIVKNRFGEADINIELKWNRKESIIKQHRVLDFADKEILMKQTDDKFL